MSEHIDHSPAAWQQHWASMPNSVRGLYATFQKRGFPWTEKEVRIEAWGQLCFDEAACRAVAYHMHNNRMVIGWKFISWRCEMDGPLTGGAKLSGEPPADFDVYSIEHLRESRDSEATQSPIKGE